MRAGGNEKREMNAEERIGREQNVYEKKRNKGKRKGVGMKEKREGGIMTRKCT
jgi:hypothetical protein